MKIIIFFSIVFLIGVLIGCNQQPPKQPMPIRSGLYQLAQTYQNVTVNGTINFYDSNNFTTTIKGSQHSYTYTNLSISQVECTEIGGNGKYTFTVMNTASNGEKWQSVYFGTLLVWDIKK